MGQITNSDQRYGLVSIVLHWLMALLLITLLALGLYMVELPDAAGLKRAPQSTMSRPP